MKLVIQRVKESNVKVDGKIVGQIENGLLVLVGFTYGDNEEIADKVAKKLINLRIFCDENDKMNLSLLDKDFSLLVISQFTLYADCTKGNRPSFVEALNPNDANNLYEYFIEILKEKVKTVERGVFGADMKVSLINDGPVTIILDSNDL